MFDVLIRFFVNMSPLLGVLLISLFASLIITIAYKFLTDQKKMKELKTKLKDSQTKMKELQKKNKTKEMMKEQQVAMEANMEYMRHSMKPTLITMLPLLLIFGMLSNYFAFYQLSPGEDFSVFAVFDKSIGNATLQVPEELTMLSDSTQNISKIALTEDAKKTIIDKNPKIFSKVRKNTEFDMIMWKINPSKEGRYNLDFVHEGKTYTKSVLISKDRLYDDPALTINENGALGLIIGNRRIEFNLFIFGWKVGWLGMYIISSLIFGTALRKIFKVG